MWSTRAGVGSDRAWGKAEVHGIERRHASGQAIRPAWQTVSSVSAEAASVGRDPVSVRLDSHQREPGVGRQWCSDLTTDDRPPSTVSGKLPATPGRGKPVPITDRAIHPRDLLTLEQQELYDGVLADCTHNDETATAVLDRYADMVDEQARDVTVVRAALGNVDVTSEATRVGLHRPLSGPGGTHPAWCTRPHPPQGPHCSDTATVNQDSAGHKIGK